MVIRSDRPGSSKKTVRSFADGRPVRLSTGSGVSAGEVLRSRLSDGCVSHVVKSEQIAVHDAEIYKAKVMTSERNAHQQALDVIIDGDRIVRILPL